MAEGAGGKTASTSASLVSVSDERKSEIWRPEYVTLLSEWADKAMCYRWLHFRSYQSFNRYNIWFTIPVIIISTLTGTANFAVQGLKFKYASIVIGSFNIFAGIISTIHHFLKITELNEAHKFASVAWDKFYRSIKLELRKTPEDNIYINHMIKLYKDEYDRLMETSPTICDTIIVAFKQQFSKTRDYKDVNKPEICDELVPTLSIVYSTDAPNSLRYPTRAKLDTDMVANHLERMKAEYTIQKLSDNVNRSRIKPELIEKVLREFNSPDDVV